MANLTVTFYMRGGHAVVANNVSEVEMTRNTTDGTYTGYTLSWNEGKRPAMFTLSIPDIVAVHAVNVDK